MLTVHEILIQALPKAMSFEDIVESSGLSEKEVEERVRRLASRGDAMEVKPGWWLALQ